MLDLNGLLDEGGLTAPVDAGFDGPAAERLGRSLGTLALRRGHGRVTFALAFSSSVPPALRDGLVRGLVQSGQDVVDHGHVSEPAWAEAATHPEVSAGIFLGMLGEQARLRLLLGGFLTEEARAQLADVFAAGDFAAGEGSLALANAAGA